MFFQQDLCELLWTEIRGSTRSQREVQSRRLGVGLGKESFSSRVRDDAGQIEQAVSSYLGLGLTLVQLIVKRSMMTNFIDRTQEYVLVYCQKTVSQT